MGFPQCQRTSPSLRWNLRKLRHQLDEWQTTENDTGRTHDTIHIIPVVFSCLVSGIPRTVEHKVVSLTHFLFDMTQVLLYTTFLYPWQLDSVVKRKREEIKEEKRETSIGRQHLLNSLLLVFFDFNEEKAQFFRRPYITEFPLMLFCVFLGVIIL